MEAFDIAIVGAGLAGNIAALALADSGKRVALVAPAGRSTDGRTTALMAQSMDFIRNLGLFEEIAAVAAPLETMRILDGTGRLFRAPPVSFRSSEVGLPAFGYNIPNAPFLTELETRISAHQAITRLEAKLERLVLTESAVELHLSHQRSIVAGLVAGADGRQSEVRRQSGIAVRAWTYPQTALVLNFAHDLPHANTSTEFHTEHGPFTQVPLPGRRSSLVWVLSPREAEATRSLALEALGRAVEERMQSLLGRVTVEAAPQAFPLSGMQAERFGKGRVVLLGEAAHAFPPIGAQGLNLSLRDVMALRDLLADPSRPAATIGEAFDRSRRADIQSRTMSVDLLNRSLLSGFLPVQILRTAGLHMLSAIGPLRSVVMREGVEPGGSWKAVRDTLRERVSRKQA
ncbi:UbiH/UbiF family hydroxylase [Rhizobium sp. TRM96647]|uniref:UbiH/UbiF family hydroxylase n=1 Tax=unclassified Rhizobium TaxID=2613769 RepID=UPI0021E6F02E|nr:MULTISPECIES: UbiH/UbiF family hydroxylase [unclassified Rhizobium]MCV3738321.1 UbiH/UbiF family hydroxylase [Rhizobium sp. TRM96647]MCV3759930.1 UbiH/UbiF family hydroxylase [Rhizobium sp. TRM96650]